MKLRVSLLRLDILKLITLFLMMLIKEKKSRIKDIKELKSLLQEELTNEKRRDIEQDLKNLIKGEKGEYDAAYHINFYYKDLKGTAVIHDLRLEYNGQVAQIDHLLITRTYCFNVIESKNYSSQVKINDNGEFQIFNARLNRYQGIESPIEQNKRHIHVLKEFLVNEKILPNKLGIQYNPTFCSFILFSPESVIERPKNFDTKIVVKTDSLKTVRDQLIEEESDDLGNFFGNVMNIAKYSLSSKEEVRQVAEKIVSYHKPSKPFNYRKKYGIPKVNQPGKTTKPKPKLRPRIKNNFKGN